MCPPPLAGTIAGQQASTSAYVAEMTTELAGLSRGSGLELIAYLLDIVRLEASTTAARLARNALPGDKN